MPSLDFARLSDIARAEAKSNALTPLWASFWDDLGTLESELVLAVRGAAQSEGVISPVFRIATDQLNSFNLTAEELWRTRERKIFMRATAREVSPKDLTALANNERAMLEEMRDTLDRHRPRREKAVMPPGV